LLLFRAKKATLMRNLQIYRYITEVAKSGSVRKAAEKLAITPSSLNRRIQSFEYEIGGQIFERNARGVRLNPAGELAVHAFKKHLADVEELKARIEDLKGNRRGRVAIKASQALLPHFLPKQVLKYQKQFPGVDFSISVADLVEAEQALLDYDVDLAVLFSALPTKSFKTIARVEQSVFAIMAPGHPLADFEKLNLSQCVEFPLALHDSSFSVGQFLEAQAHSSRLSLKATINSNSFILLQNYIMSSDAVGFEIGIGLDESDLDGLIKKPLALNKVNTISVQLVQLRGRTLSVAAAKFAEQIGAAFMAMSEEKVDGSH
jgi:DNA-binding transcriptional LysR family regulator